MATFKAEHCPPGVPSRSTAPCDDPFTIPPFNDEVTHR